jgi:hypothetical protein
MTLGEGEPPAGPWWVELLSELIDLLMEAPGPSPDRPVLVAIDGRGGGGKTTLSARIAAAVPGADVVHTDDIAWNHSCFGWDDLLVAGILKPLRRGEEVHYQPPAWSGHGRTGHIDVPAGSPLVIVEGTGSSRCSVAHLFDTTVWVQADVNEAERRARARDGDNAEARREWDEWMIEEIPFFRDDRPWKRADVTVAGTSDLSHDPATQVVLASAGPRRTRVGSSSPTGPETASIGIGHSERVVDEGQRLMRDLPRPGVP